VTSNFTFLEGGSHPEELVTAAAALGHRAVAITDTNTLAGVVRAHVAAKDTGIRLVIGCRLVLTESDGLSVLVYPTDRASYSGLCRLLTLGKRRAPKGECFLSVHDLAEHSEGLLAVLEPGEVIGDAFLEAARGLAGVFGDGRLSVAASVGYRGDDAARVRRVRDLCAHLSSPGQRVPMVATNRVLYHEPGRRALQDVLTCIRHGCTIDAAGLRLEANAERCLKPGSEMARLFAGSPGAVARTVEIADRASGFSLDQLAYRYPAAACPEGVSPIGFLCEKTWAGARRRYPDGIPEKTRGLLDYELAFIEELAYEAYFLTCADIVEFARSRGILCQGRGGAANSAVCYCLGITEVDPAAFQLLFERFISRERAEPPDIDIDFEHERREEVLQYIYEGLRARAGGDDGGGDLVPGAERGARGGQGDGAARGLRGRAGEELRPLGERGGRGRARPRDRAEPRRAPAAPGDRPERRAHGVPAAPVAACGRDGDHGGGAVRPGADRERGDGGPDGHRVGQGRHRRAGDAEGGLPGAGDAVVSAKGVGAVGKARRHAGTEARGKNGSAGWV
jgi:error-prone DNA polymerase